MCFAPQRRALFRHLNFQKWSGPGVLCNFWLRLFRHLNFQKWPGPGVLCKFWLRNVLRATTACNFSSLIWPAGSAPAALASLLFNPPEPQIIGKTQFFATFPPFRDLDLLSSDSFSFFSSLLFPSLPFPSLPFSSLLFSSLPLLFSSLLWLFPPLLFICPYCWKSDF